jgi:DegV family protein with EDD domain
MELMDQRCIAVVTDSTCDLPEEVVRRHGIHVIPQALIMGEDTWQDGVDIDPASFYELLRRSPDFPSTSQPSVQSFQDLFVRLSKEAEGIAAILVSDELSGTINSAHLAAANLPDIPIEVVDSRAVSVQLGLIALEAARAAEAGKDLETVTDAARRLVGRTHLYFTVDTLEYLHRGGRIGGAQRLVGSALSLKPLLEISDGVVAPVARIRTRRKALASLRELVHQKAAGASRLHMAVVHVAAREEAARLQEQLEADFHPVELLVTECGPVIGAHGGPGTVGVAFWAE